MLPANRVVNPSAGTCRPESVVAADCDRNRNSDHDHRFCRGITVLPRAAPHGRREIHGQFWLQIFLQRSHDQQYLFQHVFFLRHFGKLTAENLLAKPDFLIAR